MTTPKGAASVNVVLTDGEAVSTLDPQVQDRLGAMLKQHFDDLVSAPVPDQFLVLLAELEAREKASGR